MGKREGNGGRKREDERVRGIADGRGEERRMAEDGRENEMNDMTRKK